MAVKTVLAVTGSSGAVGGLVAAELHAHGLPLRLLARDPSRAPDLSNTEVAQCSYDDEKAARRALEGVETLFMVSAAETPHRAEEHRTFVEAATSAGVRHIVYTSFVGAAPDAIFTLARDHFVTESHIKDSGMSYTILRDNLYLDFVPNMVGEDDVIRGPGGDGSAAVVARHDVAAVAATVMRDPTALSDTTYELTGPQALSFHQMAGVIAKATGRPVTYVNESLADAYASRAKWQAPAWQVQAWVSTYLAVAAGVMARVSPDVETITATPPMGLADFLVGSAGEA